MEFYDVLDQTLELLRNRGRVTYRALKKRGLMKRRTFPVMFILLGMVVLPSISDACSTFCLLHQDQPLFGRNYDWMVGDAFIMINKRDVAKTAMGQNPARWTSTYGSVTFNQYGRELPMGGMNEAGVVVATLWLKDTEYAAPDHRPAVNTLQWMQYQLDTARTVEEVIASDADIRVRPGGSAKVHYFVCDRTGTCASIEFLHGKLVAHTKDNMAVKALTNDSYSQSMSFLQEHEIFGGVLPLPTSHRSLDRFARAASLVSHYDPQTSPSAVDYAFEVLTNVAQGPHTKSPTQWSLVYDLHHRRIYFRTLVNPHRRYIDALSTLFGEMIDKALISRNLKMDIQPKMPCLWPVKPWGHKISNPGNMGLSEGLLSGSRL